MEKMIWVASPETCRKNYERAIAKDKELSRKEMLIKEEEEMIREAKILTAMFVLNLVVVVIFKFIA